MPNSSSALRTLHAALDVIVIGMANEQSKISFAEEFEELKARHGAQYADLKVVRFTDKDGQVGFRAFVPYACRENDAGDIICEEERPV